MNHAKLPVCVGLFLLVVTLSLGGCASPPPPPTPITVQLAWTHQAQFAGLYAADQKGYYAEEGLAPTFLESGATIDKFAPLLAGQAQFGLASADELILARAAGQPVRAIATIYRRSPIVFISLVEKGLTRPQDFVGKTIRVSDNVIPSLRAMMAWVGVTPDQYSEVKLSSDMARFGSGDVPVWGVYINSITVEILRAGYKINVVYPDDFGVHFYADTLFTTDDTIATNPKLVQRFLRATLKGWTYAVEHPDEVPALVLPYAPSADAELEYDRMLATLPLVNTGEDNIGWMKPEVWAAMEATLRQQGVVTAPLDVTQVYTLQFLQEIYSR